nr:hypothetical protein [Candidatus Enterovibrio escacola]
MPSFIRPRYRFNRTYAFSGIRFLKVPRNEQKERCAGSMASNYTLLSMIGIILVISDDG